MVFKRSRYPLESLGISPATETTILAVIVGVLTSFGVILFKNLIYLLQSFFWNSPTIGPEVLFEVPVWRRMIIPVIGGMIVGPTIYFFARETKGHGVPEVMEAVVTNNSIIKPVVAVIKIIVSVFSIATGGSCGREGPIVQIGAAIASTAGQAFKLRPPQMKTLVGCGVAAGIGATFNAPIAGTLFALELIVSDFGLTSFTPIIVSAVISTAITRHYMGNAFEFALPHFEMLSGWEFLNYLVLGAAAGVVGFLFTKSLYAGTDLFKKTRIPEWIRPAAGGVLIGIIAIKFPHIMGVGYDAIGEQFDGRFALNLMLGLVFLKIAATSITLGSGGSGGVFSPSLFIGAMLGGSFGIIFNAIAPGYSASAGAYALVGMAAVNGACTFAPLSAIIVLVELTNNYSMILPLMFTVPIATFVSRKLWPESIYTTKLARKGIHVHRGEDMNILRAANVEEILRHDESVISKTASVEELINLSLTKHRNVIFVVEDGDTYRGLITLQNLKHIMADPHKQNVSTISDDYIEESPALTVDQSLDQAFTIFGDSGYDRLPVVNARNELVGSVVISDIIEQYNREVVNRNIAIELGSVIHSHDRPGKLRLDSDNVVQEMHVPSWMDGRTIKDLGLRKNYGITVFLVKECGPQRETRMMTPGPDYTLRQGDVLLVSGDEKEIETLERM